MHVKSILRAASATGALMLSVSCAGSMDAPPEPQGKQAELVSQKREWLKGYFDDCQVCFTAFEQCERGSISADETSACQVALDACVRGGLKDDGDDDAVDGGAADDDQDDDGKVDEADAGVDLGDDDDADAGDANDDDADAGDADDVDVDAGDEDDDGKAEDPNKGKLIEDVGVCLADLRTCIGADNADRRACIGELKSCVKEAVSGAFQGVCQTQINECVKERVPASALERVRDLCEEALLP